MTSIIRRGCCKGFFGFILTLMVLSLAACGGGGGGGAPSGGSPGGGTPAYSLTDLQGNWLVQALATGPGAPSWTKGTATITSDGSYTFPSTTNDGSTDNQSGTFNINANGNISIAGNTTYLGNMDSDKRVFVGTDTWGNTTSYPGTTEMEIALKTGSAYTSADLTGKWNACLLASGPGAPWWERATGTIAADGSFTSTAIQSDGSPDNPSGTFSIATDGTVSFDGGVVGYMDADKSIMVITDTWTGPTSPGTAEMNIMTKVASSYTTADLAGTWKVHILASGYPGLDAPWWGRGTVTIAADGSFTVATVDSNGATDSSSGTFSVSPNGEVIGSNGVDGYMDANKTVIVTTDTWDDGTTTLSVLVKEKQ